MTRLRLTPLRASLALILLAACSGSAWLGAQDAPNALDAAGAVPEPTSALRSTAQAAVSSDAAVSARAVAMLRAAGPEGLDALFSVHGDHVDAMRGDPELAGDSERLRAAFDTVAAQRDAFASGLYWYTDLDDAIGAARDTGRPILSLRLLGRLDEELSCANSRLFRTLLYANAEVGAYLRENFVLHWSSERAAPVVTIDMGDGRTLTRTITGNSAHYVLDAEGRPVDVLPGLYTPEVFVSTLEPARLAAKRSCEGTRAACLSEYHRAATARMAERWQTAWTRANRHARESATPEGQLYFGAQPLPLQNLSLGGPFVQTALAIDQLTITKSLSEGEILRLTQIAQGLPPRREGDPWWTLAGRFANCASDDCDIAEVDDGRVLDAGTFAMIRLKSGDVSDATVQARASMLFDAASEDTVRNEFVMHRDVHAWFAAQTTAPTFAQVNAWLYATVFLTPADDPWLGLQDPTVYDAIER